MTSGETTGAGGTPPDGQTPPVPAAPIIPTAPVAPAAQAPPVAPTAPAASAPPRPPVADPSVPAPPVAGAATETAVPVDLDDTPSEEITGTGDLSQIGGAHGPGRVAYFIERFILLVGLIVVLLFFSIWHKTSAIFGSSTNFQQLASAQSFDVVISMALLIPLLCGEFDLSVGQVAGFSQIAAAVAMSKHGFTFGESIAVAVVVGALIGFINGNTVARVGVNSLIVTLGTSTILGGVINWYTKGTSIETGIHTSVINFGALNSVLGIPRVVFLAAGVVLLVWYVVNHTPYGRYLASIGSNRRAAQLVGLPVQWIKLSAFVFSGALAGLAGILLLASSGSGSPGAGTILDTLTALAAVFLGATAIKPGRFNVEGTVIAIYFLAATVGGLELAGLPSYVNQVFNGAALFIAVIVSTELRNRRTGSVGA
jgi:ribose transport system permease protein